MGKGKDEMERVERNAKALFEAVKTLQTNMSAVVATLEELTRHVNRLEEAEEERKRKG